MRTIPPKPPRVIHVAGLFCYRSSQLLTLGSQSSLSAGEFMRKGQRLRVKAVTITLQAGGAEHHYAFGTAPAEHGHSSPKVGDSVDVTKDPSAKAIMVKIPCGCEISLIRD